jgi:MoxR-like ATPase
MSRGQSGNDGSRDKAAEIARCAGVAASILAEVRKSVVGQDEVIVQVLLGLFASGHVIVEGLPGLGKTLLVRAVARAFGGRAARVQFTPDLMPSDITGHVLFNIKTGAFETRRGPVFTHLLIADEINRAPAKTQAALLEVMQERQVTLEGESIPLDPPFMALATQNPLEHEGTYPLPDAQLDRFLLKIQIDYPSAEQEAAMVRQVTEGRVGDDLPLEAVETVTSPQGVVDIQKAAAGVEVADRVVDYAVRIVRRSREWPGIATGAGPRGSLALVRAARVKALLDERAFVVPDDVKAVALPALRHRIVVSPAMEIEGHRPDGLLVDLLGSVETPRE